MPLFAFGASLLGALLSFTSVVHGGGVDPTEDFCSLSAHMSRAPPSLLIRLYSLFIDQRSKHIVVQKDGILYIAGGWMLYSSGHTDYNGPSSCPIRMHNLPPFARTNDETTSLDTILRSLNVSESFKTSGDSVNYVRTEDIPVRVPGVSSAAFFPTESGFDLTFGEWLPYNSTLYGKKDPPIEDNRWQYDIATQQWTDTGILLRNWYQSNTSRRVSSSMTAWIPSLKKGFLFGGTLVSVNETSLMTTELEEHNGLITYDQATSTWTNETTPFGGISEGGLVHITTATDEVLIQFGGRSETATHLVCHSIY